jgi:quercetin dioxygenase-like cupin family protein
MNHQKLPEQVLLSNPVQELHGTHPLGQTLIVTAGCGWVQHEGGPVQEIRAGDVIQFAPNEKHWHGATATTAMTHIAIHEQLNGKAVEWLEKVSDDQYHLR